jgi:hypothetical protein
MVDRSTASLILTLDEHAHEQLVNSRLAYVSVSRGRYDAQIYTNDAQNLSEELSRETSKRSALEGERSRDDAPSNQHTQEESRREVEREETQQHSMGVED